jgi:hypothetical protein
MEDIGRPNVSPEMKQYCQSTECRRLFITEHFVFEKENQSLVNHDCCDNCKLVCKCTQCTDQQTQSVVTKSNNNNQNRDTCNEIQNVLHQLFNSLKPRSNIMNSAITTGLSPHLAADISLHYTKYTDEASIAANYPYLSADTVNYIYQVIKQYNTM